MDPILLRRRSGKTAALVLALGFGGGTIVLGTGGILFSPGASARFLPALMGYCLATSPFFLLAAIVALCRSELWLLPDTHTFQLLTFRPWRLRGPSVEEASTSEYSGVRVEPAPEEDGGGVVVSLVTASGESVPLRQFKAAAEADPYAAQLASAAGLYRKSDGE